MLKYATENEQIYTVICIHFICKICKKYAKLCKNMQLKICGNMPIYVK